MKSILWTGLLIGLCSAPAAAQTSEPDEPAPAGAATPQETNVEGDGDPPVRFAFPNRPSLRFGSVLRIDFRLRLQGDGLSYSPEEVGDDSAWRKTSSVSPSRSREPSLSRPS